jgi:putative colanic acid biosynthesis acetyltransferase WcaF
MNTEKTSSVKTDLSRFNNEWYQQPTLLKNVSWIVCKAFFFQNNLPIPVSIKRLILRVFGAKIGLKVMIKPNVNIKYPWLLSVGNYVWIGEGVWIDNLAPVNIGDHACISQGAMLLTGNHNYKRSTFDLMVGSITLAEGVWIGAKSVVCPNVNCESHAVLSVGSVATKNLKQYGVYQGNPAVWLKEREVIA